MEKVHWPAWFYGPDGQSGIFNAPLEVPKGWHDNPNKVGDPDAVTIIPGLDEAEAASETAETEEVTPYNDITVAEIKAHLETKGIEYDDDARKAELYDLYAASFEGE